MNLPKGLRAPLSGRLHLEASVGKLLAGDGVRKGAGPSGGVEDGRGCVGK